VCVCIVRSVYSVYLKNILNETEYIVTQLKGQKGNGDMQAAKRDRNAPPTPDHNIWL